MADTHVAERAATRARSFPWGVVSVVVMAVVLTVLIFTYQAPADQAEELGSRIRCPVCQGVPIADSPAPMARDMMALLRQTLEEGATTDEAIDAVLGAYPGSLLLQPELSAETVALWLIPLLTLIIGGGSVLTLRRGQAGADLATERHELIQRQRQVQNDLDDLAGQEAVGEVDEEAARHLRLAYQAELAEVQTALREAPPAAASTLPRSRVRVAVGAVLMVGSMIGVVALAGAFLVDRPGTASGVVGGLEGDPTEFSNETLAAVIAANEDHPQINGMRLALAERLFEEGDYQGAFPYYLDVASSENSTDAEAATALTRLGWMAFDGNGEVETALQLLGEARELMPDDPFPIYIEGLVAWCGASDPAAAAEDFRQVLSMDLGDTTVRSQVESDLAAAQAGEECSR